MDEIQAQTKMRLARELAGDEIYGIYFRSAAELEERFERIAAALPPEHRKILVGYSDCLKLMQLRVITFAGEKMVFPEA